jgi:hypothetical protein
MSDESKENDEHKANERGGSPSPTSRRRLKAHERQIQALELRLAGVGFRQIASTLGYKSPSGAHDAVMTALDKTLQEPSDRVRKVELERLDRLLSKVYPIARTGSLDHITVCLDILTRRARLLGLDQVKVEHSISPDQLTGIVQAFALIMQAAIDRPWAKLVSALEQFQANFNGEAKLVQPLIEMARNGPQESILEIKQKQGQLIPFRQN